VADGLPGHDPEEDFREVESGPEVGVKCGWSRGFLASHALTVGCLDGFGSLR
jgi:hypothetical protein